MESELHQYKQQDSYIEEVKLILHQKEPSLEKLVEISLKQEKMKNDQKYFKILEILKNKDTVINALKSKLDQYKNSADSFHQDIQQFEMYKQHMIQEIEQKANLFKLNNEGKDISTLAEVKHEFDIISNQLNEKVEEINNYNIVITNLEEKNKALVTDLEQMQKKFLEKDTHISSLKKQITDLEEKNADQKDQVNKLVEKVTSLAEDNMKNFSERSKTIEKGETYIHQVKELTDEIQNFKEINSKLEEEKNQINSVHMDFLLSCHNLINPGMEIGEDWDLEFVQNGILNNIKDMHDSIENYKKRHEDDGQLLKHMEKEIHKVQQALAGKKYSTQISQTDMLGGDVLLLTSRIDQLEHEYQKVIKENEEMVRYIGDLENTVNKLSMENDNIEKQMLNDKKYMKSTTSLAYSIDDENDNNFEIQKNSIGNSGNSPTFRVDDKENISLNSSSQTISDVIDTSRVKNSDKKVIKLNKIKIKSNKSELLDPSLLKNKSAEQQILIVEQRRQIEELKKFNLNLEGKYNYEVKDKNHTISSLERKIEGLQMINNKLKLEKNHHEGTEDNLEHYIQQLEIDKVSLENELQDALKEREYFEHDNDELSLQVQDLESLNLALRNKLETPDFNIDEETTVNILSLKVSKQKKEIRQLKGNLEKTKNKYENLLLQLTPKHTEEYAIGGDLLQSSLSYSLGASKEFRNKDLIHIDSLVSKNPNNKNHQEKLLENSLLNSLQSVEEKTTGRNRLKKSVLKSSDLEVPAHKKSKAKDDTELLVHNMGEKESVVKWLHSQLTHHQKLVSHLASEIESLINQNNDINREVIEMRQDYVDKINTLHNQFSEEKEVLIQEKREYESKFNIAKLDIKLGYKEEKIKQLQKRLSELREEFDSESSSFKNQLKQYKTEISDCNKRFETQQDELDKCNGSLLEKQSQIEILTETIQTLQQQDYDSMSAKFLDQNAELCRYRGMNQKLEFEVQLYYQKIHNKQEENISLKQELSELEDKYEEDRDTYEILTKEIDNLTQDFESLESEKNKCNSEIEVLTRKNQNLNQKLAKKEDEIRLLKSQVGNSKKLFEEKVIQLRKEFNEKLVDYGNNAYSNNINNDKILFEDSFVQSKVNLKTDSLAGSVLRMSHLGNSKASVRPDISCLQKLEEIEEIDDIILVHNKLIDQIIELTKQNRILEMQVIYSDTKLKEDSLSVNLTQEIENLQNHLQYFRNYNYQNSSVKEYIVSDTDQNRQIESYKLLRELSKKTTKISILEKRISKLEMSEKSAKIQSYEEKISLDDTIQNEIEAQAQNIENYIK